MYGLCNLVHGALKRRFKTDASMVTILIIALLAPLPVGGSITSPPGSSVVSMTPINTFTNKLGSRRYGYDH